MKATGRSLVLVAALKAPNHPYRNTKETVIRDDRAITPGDFVDYEHLDLRFKTPGLAEIPFGDIGLQLNEYRLEMPDKRHYRNAIKEYYKGIGSMPGTHKKIDTAKVVEEGPVVISGVLKIEKEK